MIAIIDYGMGNLTSVKNSLEFIGYSAQLVEQKDELANYDTIIIPGVGAFAKAMEALQTSGMDMAIKDFAKQGKKIVGICLGMQLLFEESYEFGYCQGLGLIEGSVLPFSETIDLSIPHVGWNEIEAQLEEFAPHNGDYYFVHSYYCQPKKKENILFTTNYGIEFCTGVIDDNQIFGLQFHPEKSQKKGLELLKKILGNG